MVAAIAEHLVRNSGRAAIRLPKQRALGLMWCARGSPSWSENETADVEFVDNGTVAVRLLLKSWPLPANARVALTRSEFASNRMVLERLEHHGLSLHELPERADGRLDLEQVAGVLRTGIDGRDLACSLSAERAATH